MTAMALMLLAVTDSAVEVRAVRLTPVSSRIALRVLTSLVLPATEVRRSGDEVVVPLDEASADAVILPPLEPPVEGLRFDRSGGKLYLHVRVAPEVPFEAVQEDTLLTVFFGEEQADELRMRSARELYGQLFPVPLEGSAAPLSGAEYSAPEEPTDGWRVGRVSVKPGLTASYVNADTLAGESIDPVRDRYLQIGPSVELATPVGEGTLRASYEPRFRLFSSIPEVGTTTHVVNGGLDLPLGTRVVVQGNYHFSHGVLETREVDPGQEYFFDLGRFNRNDLWTTVAVELGPRMTARVGAGWNDVEFSGSDQFFPYRETTVNAGLSYELGAAMKGTLEYVRHSVPPSDERPLVASTGDDVLVGVQGEIAPLLRGRIEVGYRHWSSPDTIDVGRTYSGLLATVALQRQFAQDSYFDLRAGRTTNLSAYALNAFYISTAVEGAVSTPVPLGLTARAAVGYQWNTYKIPDLSIGVPREDTIFGWAIGVGRDLSRRSYVRADYRRDQRRSNIPGFDVTTDGFIVQFGIGFAPSGARR